MKGWRTGFEVAKHETEWCNTPPHGKHSLREMVITRQYVQINPGIPVKVISKISGYKCSKVVRCYECTSSVQQQAVTASINNTVSDPITLYCFHVNCFLPNMNIAM